MLFAPGGKDLLSRSLRTSWLVALALTALLLPSRPDAALALAAGQLIAWLNFVFLRALVKLFTDRAVATPDARAPLPQGRIMFVATVKTLLVYGGAFALIRGAGVEFAPFMVGLGLPLATLFLKSIMLAFGNGPSSLVRQATATVGSLGSTAKPAALFLLASLASLVLPALARAAEEAAHAAEHGAQELPNWIVILHDYFPHNPVVHWLEQNQILVFAWVGGLTFLAVSWIAMRKPKFVPGQLQNAIEWMVEGMEEVCEGLLGKHIHRYFPFVGAIFFYVLTMNLLGIIPGLKSATSSLDLTLALALITFIYVQYRGIRNLGLFGYLDHLAGSPRDPIGFAMLPVMVPVHILGELAKPVSLSCRLFGNIFGEDTLIVVFVGATALCLKAGLSLLAVPPMMGITALFMMLQTLTAIVQALIFSLLATVYLYMMLPHESEGHGQPAHGH